MDYYRAREHAVIDPRNRPVLPNYRPSYGSDSRDDPTYALETTVRDSVANGLTRTRANDPTY